MPVRPKRNFKLPPKMVLDECLKYEADTHYDGVKLKVYKWCCTDYVDVIWYMAAAKKGQHTRAVGMMELFYLQHYASYSELIDALPTLTDEMAANNWGYIDKRDFSVKRVFDVEVP